MNTAPGSHRAPGNPIKVLVVDDSALVRRIIVQALTGLDGITVVGVAAHGGEALTQIEALNPDIVTLDIEMPVMDGIETMRAIRRTRPRLPVIMFSTLTERGARATFDALAAGARDYVTKPTNSSGLAESLATIRHELGTRIHALCDPPAPATVPAVAPAPLHAPGQGHSAAPAVPRTTAANPATVHPATVHPATVHPSHGAGPRESGQRVDVVAIGSSTGGPDALATVLAGLPKDLAVPVLLVQHMPPVFTAMLAERLDRLVPMTVREACVGDPLTPGVVYLAPGDHHLTVTGTAAAARVGLNQGPQENYCRPAVDVLFRSVAAVYGAHALAVVLTGMGSDGTIGARALTAKGVPVFAQDHATSVVWGMPGAVVSAGLASKVLPLTGVADAITTRIRTGRSTR